MKQVDFKKLESDLAANDKQAIKQTLVEFFSSELTPEERGAILVNFTLVYARMKNQIQEQYLEMLNEALEDLKTVNELERAAGEEVDLEAVRKKINEA